jgi:hypothetical protein
MWDVRVALLPGRPHVSDLKRIQNLAILINRSPQIVNAAIDLEEDFIKMPLVCRRREDLRRKSLAYV